MKQSPRLLFRAKTSPKTVAFDLRTGRAIKKQRIAAGLSIKFIAMTLGVTSAYICQLEHGRRHWTDAKIQACLLAIQKNKTTKS
jgi:predicted transcriptional regulator